MAQVAPTGGTTGFNVHDYTSVGGRGYQEDRGRNVPDFNAMIPETTECDKSIRRSLFCIFDGHGGDQCSIYCHANFHKVLAANVKVGSDPKAAILETWDIVEAGFRAQSDKRFERIQKNFKPKKEGDQPKYPCDGSTGSCAFLVGNKFYIAACGDSTIGVIKKDKQLTEFTADHSTVNPSEVERCIAGGARFDQKMLKVPAPFPHCCTKMVEKPNGKPRIYPGGLLVTRAFGDLHAKIPEVGGCPGGVIHTPDPIREVDIGDDWIWFIVASDGVWDAFPDYKKIHGIMKREQEDAEFDYGKDDDKKEKVQKKMTKGLVQTAVDSEYWTRTGSDADNTTAIVLFFQ